MATHNGRPLQHSTLNALGRAANLKSRFGEHLYEDIMQKVKTIEFWLFALAALFVLAGLLATDRIPFVRQLLPIIAVAWSVLAIAWMFRAFFRWVRD
jgi:hypothetical protein